MDASTARCEVPDSATAARLPAGWYRCVDGPARRWWDGQAWTDHVVVPAPQPVARPTVAHPTARAVALAVGVTLLTFVVVGGLAFFAAANGGEGFSAMTLREFALAVAGTAVITGVVTFIANRRVN